MSVAEAGEVSRRIVGDLKGGVHVQYEATYRHHLVDYVLTAILSDRPRRVITGVV